VVRVYAARHREFVFLFPFFFRVNRVQGGVSRSYFNYSVSPYDDGSVFYQQYKLQIFYKTATTNFSVVL